ncbi:MAG: hypothetical protein ACKPKO_35170, partial [Candidatus Fonsibacter sp.]
MDEILRRPIKTYIALASHSKTVVAVGDRRQELYPYLPPDQAGLHLQTFANPTHPHSIADS